MDNSWWVREQARGIRVLYTLDLEVTDLSSEFNEIFEGSNTAKFGRDGDYDDLVALLELNYGKALRGEL